MIDLGWPTHVRARALESEYWLLLLSGVGTFEACRIVGIGGKTGYRWRAENSGLPQTRRPEQIRSRALLL